MSWLLILILWWVLGAVLLTWATTKIKDDLSILDLFMTCIISPIIWPVALLIIGGDEIKVWRKK